MYNSRIQKRRRKCKIKATAIFFSLKKRTHINVLSYLPIPICLPEIKTKIVSNSELLLIEFLTPFTRSPNIDQNVTLAVVL